jgi:hypothetical protein
VRLGFFFSHMGPSFFAARVPPALLRSAAVVGRKKGRNLLRGNKEENWVQLGMGRSLFSVRFDRVNVWRHNYIFFDLSLVAPVTALWHQSMTSALERAFSATDAGMVLAAGAVWLSDRLCTGFP